MHISKFNILDSYLAHTASIIDHPERATLQLDSSCSLRGEVPVTWQILLWQLLVEPGMPICTLSQSEILFRNQGHIPNIVSEIAYLS